ncbi:elongation factor P 5-aminopentanone reductase [Anaerobacillus isosaccharinicus]|uniref:3-oxoacyl-ACP reductase n=1 Tax=Anaerobacillus isosaccharinicus TaxID=1532552 RepID=A0A1S2MB81_9BACI|nr:SDR family oxidoreductase [Anaerobacillus isosaccharinicus]MBA5587270.1 SDR family oxidoreductase [Anaerobacillus isosaccharinicus]QOY34537.1 SDR family oxidoreductase [Anaerobacillus isosaccharinicus]
MKYALITGASGGIGREIAIALAKEGYCLYLHYHTNEQSIDDLREHLASTQTWKIKANLAAKTGVSKILEAIPTSIDVLVLNSGNSYVGLMTDMEDTQVEEMIQLHLTSPFLLTKALLPLMVQKKAGNIVAVSSIWGVTGASCEVLYSTLKGGLNTFVKALAKEVAPSGIRVNGVAPGAIATKMMGNFSDDEIESLCDEIPMGRLGEPKEVAALIAFLISNQAPYLNGQIININGAWYC